MIKCNECNKEINKNIKKCPYCGCPNYFHIKKDNKKFSIILIISTIITIIILSLIVWIFVLNKDNKELKDNNKLDTFKVELLEVGSNFYEDYYYDTIISEEKNTFLSNYSVSGIKIDLNNLLQVFDKKEWKISNEIINKCDKNKTKIIIYPKEPYNKKDYEIIIDLFCEL